MLDRIFESNITDEEIQKAAGNWKRAINATKF